MTSRGSKSSTNLSGTLATRTFMNTTGAGGGGGVTGFGLTSANQSRVLIEPSSIRFEHAEPGTLYVMTVSIRNLSQIAQRIRLQGPKSHVFALNYVPTGPIAPGIEMRAEIECHIPKDIHDTTIFTDRIIVCMGDERIDLPLLAHKPYPKIHFERSILLGNIMLGTKITHEIEFRNESSFGGELKLFLPSHSPIKMSLVKLLMSPKGQDGSIQTINFTFDAKIVGTVRELVRVSVGALEDETIDISANVIQQSLTLLAPGHGGGIMDIADFGKIFYGHEGILTAKLVNGGPLPLSFSIKYDDEETMDANAILSAVSGGKSLQKNEKETEISLELFESRTMTIAPMDGIVKPFSEVILTMNVNPKQRIPTKGFLAAHLKAYERARLITRSIRLECLQCSQVIPFTMQAHAVLPQLAIEPSVLRFGDCPVHDRRDILLTLSNHTDMPIDFQFPMIANFKFEPTHGKVMPVENVSVVATFIPPHLGVFNSKIEVSLCNGLASVELRGLGESNDMPVVTSTKRLVLGTDKLPHQFEPKYKFVNPEQEEASRAEKQIERETKKLKLEATIRSIVNATSGKPTVELVESMKMPDEEPLHPELPPIINAVNEADPIYGLGPNLEADRPTDPEELAKLRAYESRKKHRDTYNQYLQHQHTTRKVLQMAEHKKRTLQRGAIDFRDPFGINMGMERGLDEPKLNIPVANEPLYMVNTKLQGKNGSSGGFGWDENRLIQKKFPSTPATQAEMRDCQKELSSDEQKSLTASHKVVDFGRVSIGSLTYKSFVVYNPLKHTIQVNIDGLPLELSSNSRGLCQVVPEGGLSGYDLGFCSRTLGPFRSNFLWRVNGNHTFSVQVLAEVVPMSLELSSTDLEMSFPVDSLEPTTTTQIWVTNPGNAPADFLWGSVGAFTVSPEKGTVPPGKSQPIGIIWDPLGLTIPMATGPSGMRAFLANRRSEEEIGLHVTNGIDQILKVRGIQPETQAEFVEKRLNLHVLAVGTSHESRVTMRNTGKTSLVYFFQTVDDTLGVKISPSVASIPAGESQEILITVIPCMARSYDNVSLIAKIRGGKHVTLKLSGNSIIPEVVVKEESFRYGNVTIGSSRRLPLTLTNNSAIKATLVLDLENSSTNKGSSSSALLDFKPYLLGALDEPDIVSQEQGIVFPVQEDNNGNQILLRANSSNVASTVQGDSPRRQRRRRREEKESNVWIIHIPPQTTLNAELIYRPSSARKVNFRLPLSLLGLSGDPMMQKEVSTHGISSLLQFSTTIVDFGDRVVSRDALSRVSYSMETTVTNLSSSGVSFTMEEGEEIARSFDGQIVPLVEPSPIAFGAPSASGGANTDMAEIPQTFFISPVRVDLAPGASTKISITFLPQRSAQFTKFARIHLTEGPEQLASPKTVTTKISTKKTPYLSLLCVGSGLYPCMSFDRSHVRLPTVPLGVTSSAMFTVYNHGYAALPLTHRLSPGLPIAISVSYPDGDELGIMVDRLRVCVSLRLDAPLSWSGKLEFFDTDGERFWVTLAGVSDNCLLSNALFVRGAGGNSSFDYGFLSLDDTPVQFLPQAAISDIRAADAKRREEQRKQRSLERSRLVEQKSQAARGEISSQSIPLVRQGANEKASKARREVPYWRQELTGMNEGVDLDRMSIEAMVAGDDATRELEASFLLRWLNSVTRGRRRFDPDRFPECLFESNGEVVFECIEILSGKKILTRNIANAHRNAGSGSSETQHASEKKRMIATADKVLQRFQSLINFLLNCGALLGHINTVNLLRREDALLMMEYDLQSEISGGAVLTPTMLATRRRNWDSEWLRNCQLSWMEVLYQIAKVFVLQRVSFRDFCSTRGVIPPMSYTEALQAIQRLESTGMSQVATTGNNKKVNPSKVAATMEAVLPKDLQSSNVYTHSELVILAWLSYHLERASQLVDEGAKSLASTYAVAPPPAPVLNPRITDLEVTFKDILPFCQLLHAHVDEICQHGEPLHGYTSMDRSRPEQLFSVLHEALNQYHCHLPGLDYQELLVSSRSRMLFFLHCFMVFPSLLPCSHIEFSGLLGGPLMRTIDIRNPANRPLYYDITLKGSPDYKIDGDLLKAGLEVPPESIGDLTIRLETHFLSPVHAKLYLWNSPGTGGPGTAAVSSTLCFSLSSKMVGMSPVERYERTMCLFDYDSMTLCVDNPFNAEVNLAIELRVHCCPQMVQDTIANNQIVNKKKVSRKHGGKKDIFHRLPTSRQAALLEHSKHSDATIPLPTSGGDGYGHSIDTIGADEWEVENSIFQPFWITEESLTIPPNGNKTLKLHMLPFVMGNYVAEVIFHDPSHGEFCHQLALTVQLPKSTDRLQLSVLQDETSRISLQVASKNINLEKALNVLTEVRLKGANKKLKARPILHQIMSPKFSSATNGTNYVIGFTNPCFRPVSVPLDLLSEFAHGGPAAVNQRVKRPTKSVFEVVAVNPLNSLAHNNQSTSQSAQGDSTTANRILIDFDPPVAGIYRSTAVIYPDLGPEGLIPGSHSYSHDIRCVDLVVTAKVPDAQMVLEFFSPARQAIVQSIPVTNETDADWQLALVLVGGGLTTAAGGSIPSPFSVPSASLLVPAHGSASVDVKFLAFSAGTFEAKLQLRHAVSHDLFEYTLRGEAEEPLAEDTLFFHCPARKRSTFLATLPPLRKIFDWNEDHVNSAGIRKLTVETDLPFTSLSSTTINASLDRPTDFEFYVTAPMGGMLSGSLSFLDEVSHRSAWFSVNVEVSAPREERTIQVSATVRQATAVEITIENPINESISFDVLLDGDGLLGESNFTLPPANSGGGATFELIYSPLRVGNAIGRVSFWNETIGEVWYKLELEALPAPPTPLGLVESMIGTEKSISGIIENPTGETVTFQLESSDPEHFFFGSGVAVQGSKLTLQPFEQSTFDVRFRPSTLGEEISGMITLSSQQLGDILYSITGIGQLPGVLPAVSIEGPLGEIVSEAIIFRNAFSHPLPVEIRLISDTVEGEDKKKSFDDIRSPDGPFQLLLNKSDMVIAAKTPFHIAVGFTPQSLGVYEAVVEVRSTVGGRPLRWCFPVHGVAQVGTVQRLPLMRTPSKSSLLKEHRIILSGIPNEKRSQLRLSDFVVSQSTETSVEKLVSRSFRIQPLELLIEESADCILRCRLLFEPLRIFSAMVDVSIVGKGLGKWRARIEVDATEPSPDDVIDLTATVGATDAVTFRLNNRFLCYSPFQAFFSSGSSAHFSVSPTNGILTPHDTTGTQFIITYAPREYGVIENATLNILTDEAQWTYSLRGHYPENSMNSTVVKTTIISRR